MLVSPRNHALFRQTPVGSSSSNAAAASTSMLIGAPSTKTTTTTVVTESDGIPEPYGYKNVSIEDQTAGFVTQSLENMLCLAGDKIGLHHLEVRKVSDSYYNCIGVGFQVPIRMDDFLALMFDQSNTRIEYVSDVYITPIPVQSLVEPEKVSKGQTLVPALVVQVMSKAFLAESRTRSLDVTLSGSGLVDESGLVGSLFPFLRKSFNQGQQQQQQQETLLLTSGYENQHLKQIECAIGSGMRSPRKRIMPSVSVQMLSALDIENVDDKECPLPIPSEGAKSLVASVREKLATVFRYLYVLHGPRDAPVTARDIPKTLVLEMDNTNPLLYRCVASGYRGKISLADMLRLYMCDPTHIRDVYYDFSRAHGGGLVVEYEAKPEDLQRISLGNNDQSRGNLIRVTRAELAAPPPPTIVVAPPSASPSPPEPKRFFVSAPVLQEASRKRKPVEEMQAPEALLPIDIDDQQQQQNQHAPTPALDEKVFKRPKPIEEQQRQVQQPVVPAHEQQQQPEAVPNQPPTDIVQVTNHMAVESTTVASTTTAASDARPIAQKRSSFSSLFFWRNK